MGNLVRTALITLTLLAFCAGRVNAAVLDSKFLTGQIKKSVIEQVSSIVKGKVEAEITDLPYKSIEVPNGKVEIITSLKLNHFNSLTVARIDIFVDGEKVKYFGVPVKLYVYDKVWVANDFINRGKALSTANLTIEKKELGALAEFAARQNSYPYNYLAKKSFKPGEIIDTRYLESKPLIIRDNPVTVIFTGSNLSITMTAQALENGKLGDYIKVRNKKLRKDYIGKVISENTIQINI